MYLNRNILKDEIDMELEFWDSQGYKLKHLHENGERYEMVWEKENWEEFGDRADEAYEKRRDDELLTEMSRHDRVN